MAANQARKRAGKQPQRKAPYRRTFTIARADESTLAWWDAQEDPSMSLKLLIRADIEEHGYTDTANRPVRQLPRRGRPPGSGAKQTQDHTSFDDGDIEEEGAEDIEADDLVDIEDDVDGEVEASDDDAIIDGDEDAVDDVEESEPEPEPKPQRKKTPKKVPAKAPAKASKPKQQPVPADDVSDDDDDEAAEHASILSSIMGDST